MDKKTVYTLSLKLKRHNLLFEFNENNKTLAIGKTKNLKIQYILGALIIVAGLLIAILTEMKIFVVLAGFGVIMIHNAYRLSKNSKYQKIFSQNYVELSSKNDKKRYGKEDINDFEYTIKNIPDKFGQDTFNGKLFLTLKDSSTIELLTLIDKNHTHLKSDFEYLTEALKKHLNVNQ